MSDRSSHVGRRRLLALFGTTALPLGLAGCSGDGGGDTSTADGAGATETETDAAAGDTASTDEPTATATATAEPTSEATASPTTSAASNGSVTVDVGLRVRESRPGFDNFDTFQTGFDGLTMQTAGGDGVQVAEPAATDGFDLAGLAPGERQHLAQTTIPAGDYEQAAILLPVQSATATGGSDPEFSRMVPATGELGTSGALTLSAGDVIDFTANLAVLRIAGDGPWTYTVGFGTLWQTHG